MDDSNPYAPPHAALVKQIAIPPFDSDGGAGAPPLWIVRGRLFLRGPRLVLQDHGGGELGVLTGHAGLLGTSLKLRAPDQPLRTFRGLFQTAVCEGGLELGTIRRAPRRAGELFPGAWVGERAGLRLVLRRRVLVRKGPRTSFSQSGWELRYEVREEGTERLCLLGRWDGGKSRLRVDRLEPALPADLEALGLWTLLYVLARRYL